MTTTTHPNDDLVGIVTAHTATVSGDLVTVHTFHADPRCSQIGTDTTVEVGVTITTADNAAWECDYCVPERRANAARYAEENDDNRTYGDPAHPDYTGRRSTRSTERTNRYAGRCAKCGGWVEAEAGLLTGTRGAWTTEHRDGECVEVPVAAPVASNERTNRFGGRCVECNGWVEADAGLLLGHPGAWSTSHRPGECVVTVPADDDTTTTGAPTEGIHRLDDGRVVKVQRGRESGNLYTKLLVVTDNADGTHDGEFIYAPGLLARCSTATIMPLDEARSYGELYGFCVVCGIRLSDEDSIRLGIGPICGGRVYEWSTGRSLTVAQVRLLGRLSEGPVAVGRQGRTAAVLVEFGLARIDDGMVIAM